MKTIFKYELQTTNYQHVQMPGGSKILCVQTQNEIPCLWAQVDTALFKENRSIRIFGTGHHIPEDQDLTYIGTYQLSGGALVFHVYEWFK